MSAPDRKMKPRERKPPPWNRCECGSIVDIDDDHLVGAEAKCANCGAHYQVASFSDGPMTERTWALLPL